jgi:predicted lipoprotein with Yx(FWY)xxD motif
LDLNAPYPQQVALTDEGDKGYVFRRCPGNERLYTYDLDTPTRSACKGACESTWTPVLAAPAARTLGQWSVVRREEGSPQWAYRGRPVYTLLSDSPYAPKGDGRDEGRWHLLPHEK